MADLHIDSPEGNKELPYQQSGSLYGRAPALEIASKPAGEWNRMTVFCQGKNIHVVLNGKAVVDANIDDWKDPLVNPDGTPVPPWHRGFPALSTIPTKGRVGFQGVHGIAAAWRGMDLGSTPVKSVLAETITDADDAVKDKVWPTSAHIVFEFDGVPASDGRPFAFEWFDGCSEPDNLAPARYRPPAEIDALYAKTPWGRRPHEGKAVKCRDGWILQPHGADFAWAVRNDGSVVMPPGVGPAPTHYHEFLNCVARGGKASTDFSWSTYMRECVIAGEIAERVACTKITWDAKTRRFDSDAANAFLTRPYRKGWEIPGLG